MGIFGSGEIITWFSCLRSLATQFIRIFLASLIYLVANANLYIERSPFSPLYNRMYEKEDKNLEGKCEMNG